MAMKLVSILACGVCIIATAAPASAQTRSFNIPAGSLKNALDAFGRQSGRPIIYQADQIRGARSAGAKGDLSVEAALRAILAGTRFHAQADSSGAIAIVNGNTASTLAAPSKTMPPEESTVSVDRDIVVTGTHISGGTSPGSALTVYDRAAIDQSGSATLDQFAREMTENFSGADTGALGTNTNATKSLLQQGAGSNIFGGAALNLYGLGPGSTLTLLNGHRLAAGGFDGSLVDISQIPLSVVERIEVLEDGASAVYGSDAIAGVVNIITKKKFDGAETSLRYAGATDGGGVERTASQLLGHSWNSGDILLNYEYDYQGGLDASQRDWIGTQGGPYTLIPRNERNSIFISADQNLGPEITTSANFLYSGRTFQSRGTLNVPSEQLDTLQTGHAHQLMGTVSADAHLFGDWHLQLTGNYSRISQLEVQNQNLTLPAYNIQLALNSRLSASTEVKSGEALLTGTLFTLPGGSVKAAFGGGYRGESFENLYISNGATSSASALDRTVGSLFGELRVPVVGAENAIPAVRSLELSVAARYDHYSDFGSTTNPKVGIAWEPVAGFRFRSTYGTSFQAPFLSQLGQVTKSETDKVPDSSAPGGFYDALVLSGGNPDLRPQKSKSWTVGGELAPPSTPGLRISVTYFHTQFTGQIQAPTYTSLALFSQPSLAPFITRNPPLALVQAYFDSPAFTGDFAGQGEGGVNVLFDDRLANIAATKEEGLSFSGRYAFDTGLGKLSLYASGTHLFRFDLRSTEISPVIQIYDQLNEPASWKVRGGIGLTKGGFSSSLTLNYTNGYNNSLYIPAQHVGSWTTADLYLSYDTGSTNAARPLRNVRLSLSIRNLTNARPPFVNYPVSNVGQNPIPYDSTNASALGRLIAFQLTKRW